MTIRERNIDKHVLHLLLVGLYLILDDYVAIYEVEMIIYRIGGNAKEHQDMGHLLIR